jgi:hypothetical protein
MIFSFIVSLLFINLDSKYLNTDCNCLLVVDCVLISDCSFSLSNVVNDDVSIKSDTEIYNLTFSGVYDITINSGKTLAFSNLRV